MATRFYYSNKVGYYNPPLSGIPKVINADKRPSGPMLLGLSLERPQIHQSTFYAVNTSYDGYKAYYAHLMFSTPPLLAGTITGSVKGQMLVSAQDTNNQDNPAMWMYLVDSNWVYKSTLLDGAANEEFVQAAEPWPAGNRKYPTGGSIALTSQTAIEGDRIIVLVGSRRYSGQSNLGGVTYTYATDSAIDLPEDETTTAQYASWLEFSETLNLMPDVFPPVPSAITGAEAETKSLSDVVIPNRIASLEDGTGSSDGVPAIVPTEGQIWPRNK